MYAQSFTIPVPVQQCGVICSDGIELMGLVTVATYESDPSVTILFIPGQFDNAYQQRKNHHLLCESFKSTLGCVLANSRGQDYYGYQRKYSDPSNTDNYTWELLGSTFERVRDADYDIEAWMGLVSEAAPRSRVVLTGHSHGAIKIANYMIGEGRNSARERISAIVLLSPSDDIGSQHAKLGDRYGEALAIAESHLEHGQEDALMPDWAFSAPMSAGTYYEAFGPGSPLRTFSFHAPEKSPLWEGRSGWTQPTLVVFGSDDAATGSISSTEACAVTKGLLSRSQGVDCAVVGGANHHYRGFEADIARRVVAWINKTTPR